MATSSPPPSSPSSSTPPPPPPQPLQSISPPKPKTKPQPSPWSHNETLQLIAAYQQKWYSLNRGQLRATQWEDLSLSLAQRCNSLSPSLSKTATQCRHKIEKLRKRYRSEKNKPNPRAWEYFDLMHALHHGPFPISALPMAQNPSPRRAAAGEEERESNRVNWVASRNPSPRNSGIDEEDPAQNPNPNPRWIAIGQEERESRVNWAARRNPNSRNLEIGEEERENNRVNWVTRKNPNSRNLGIDEEERGNRVNSSVNLYARRNPNPRNLEIGEERENRGNFSVNSYARKNPNFGNLGINEEEEAVNLVNFAKSGRMRGDESEEEEREGVAVAGEIRRFAERVMKVEERKVEMMREMERYRMEMEKRKTEMIVDSQRKILDTIRVAFGIEGNKRMKMNLN